MKSKEPCVRVQVYLDSAEEAQFNDLRKILGLGKSATLKTAIRQLAFKYSQDIKADQASGS